MLRRPPAALRVLELVGAEAKLAGAAVDERVGECVDVAGRDPDLRVEDDRRVERDHVLPFLDQRAAPLVLHVVVQQHTVVAEVERRAEPAVDVRRREDKRTAPAQRGHLLDGRRAFELVELHAAESTYSSISPSQ